MVNNTLALVMIVKNEEKGLEKCILSCKDFVDEIVIAVDNNSSDSTLEIAKKYATTLKRFDFNDDFSAARNFAHDGVKSEWILFLDGHEYILKLGDLAKYLQFFGDGLMCSIEMENGMLFRAPRIYKNGVQFDGKVHEIAQCQKMCFFPGFTIKHDRLAGQSIEAITERDKQRDDMVPRIMQERIKKDKTDVQASFHLALHAQSKQQYGKAIRWYKLFLRYSKSKGERWFSYFSIALCRLAKYQYFRAFYSASMADHETPGRWEINKLKGIIFHARGEYSKAIPYLLNTFYANVGDETYRPWSHDNGDVFDLAGECFFNLNDYATASLVFDRAAELATDEIKKKILTKRAEIMKELAKK